MSERVLRLNYVENPVVELVIPDIDKCLLIDVLNDMCEEFEKKGYELPENLVLHYGFRGVSKMFEDVKSKKIDVWIACLPEPNFIWTLAKKVRTEQPAVQLKVQSKLDKLPIKRPPKANVSPVLTPTSPGKLIMSSPRRSTRNKEPDVIIMDPNEWLYETQLSTKCSGVDQPISSKHSTHHQTSSSEQASHHQTFSSKQATLDQPSSSKEATLD